MYHDDERDFEEEAANQRLLDGTGEYAGEHREPLYLQQFEGICGIGACTNSTAPGEAFCTSCHEAIYSRKA